jgi:hypothetical protein
MIRQLVLGLLLWIPAVLLGAAPAEAQYMFLDFDGDGQYTTYDQYGGYSYGDSARVDLYVVTNEVQPGVPGSPCTDDGSAASINGYTVNLYAGSAPITVVSLRNRMAGMGTTAPASIYPYALSVSYWGSAMFPPGKYLLMSMDLIFGSGCHALEIVPTSCFSPPGEITSIWSNCIGNDFDGMLKMGVEWFTALGSYGCNHWPPHTPSVSCPSPSTVRVGETLTVTATVDAKSCWGVDGYGVYGVPGGVSGPIVSQGYGMFGIPFTWTPTSAQVGTYNIRFEAQNYDYWNPWLYHGDECSTTITVIPANRTPTAQTGGPYRGLQSVPVSFDGSLSSDPDGDNLDYLWQFGDGATGTGGAPLHTYSAGGVFTVVLRAMDPGGLADLDSTTATIARDVPVRVFTTESNDPTRLGHGKPSTCFQVEATDGTFTPDQIVPASLFLRYTDPVCGELEAYTSGAKTATVGDADKNGVLDYSACFSREAMQTLGMCVPKGSQTVRLELNGALSTGERIHGEIQHTFISGGTLAAAITPNPVSAASTLEFTTRRPGAVIVRLFDIRGRLAATLFEESAVAAGRHQVIFAALDRSGIRLASGVYFVRVISEHDGEETRRVTMLR